MQHEFVKLIPRKLKEGVLYISIDYKTATHQCACGCGSKVVTSITPTGWTLSYNGDNVSLSPSIGSWNLPCKSHYWIKNGQVVWAESWDAEQISLVQNRDRLDRTEYFNKSSITMKSSIDSPKLEMTIWAKIINIFK